jgi:hypothetical protein
VAIEAALECTNLKIFAGVLPTVTLREGVADAFGRARQ